MTDIDTTVTPQRSSLPPPEGGEVASSGSPWVLVARTFAQNRLALIGLGSCSS